MIREKARAGQPCIDSGCSTACQHPSQDDTYLVRERAEGTAPVSWEPDAPRRRRRAGNEGNSAFPRVGHTGGGLSSLFADTPRG